MFSLLKSMLFGSGLEVGPDEAVSAMNAGAQVVDIREPNEFASGAILGAVNVPLGKIQQHGVAALRNAGIDDAAPAILMVCRSGARSGSACLILRDSLGERVRNLSGGVMAWGSRGLPLTPSGRATT